MQVEVQNSGGRTLVYYRERENSVKRASRCRSTAQQVRSTRSSRATCCQRHSVTVPAETFETRKGLLPLPLAKERYDAEAILKIYGLFTY